MQYSNPKICIACKQPKDLSEYYPRGTSGYLSSECKDCMKARSKRQVAVNKLIPIVSSEGDVIAQLIKRGIPALPGKALHQQKADVIAWGCVLIEVKSSNYRYRQFCFSFTYDQRNKRLRGDIIVLVCHYEDKNTYHLFPATHPMFYNNKGKLKTAVSWTPQKRENGNGRPGITDEMMEAAEDRWQMVEDYRQRIIDKLVKFQELPMALRVSS